MVMTVGKIAIEGIKAFTKTASNSTASATTKVISKTPLPRFKIRRTGLFRADNSLFPFAKFHPLETAAGKLREDGMILCHMTEHLPTHDGKILSVFDALGRTRNSVHFSVNHPVTEHMLGDAWSQMPYAVLMPMKSALKQNGNCFVGGIAVDFFSRGSVKLPKGTIIVRRAKDVPEGALRVINARTIERFKNLRGVRIIETSDERVYDAAKKVIKKLGYEYRGSCDSELWGELSSELHENTGKFTKFLKSKGLKAAYHSSTPNGSFEFLLADIQLLARFDKSWVININGKNIYSYKNSILKMLRNIKAQAKRENLPLDVNIDAVISIVKKSSTPKEAASILREKMKLAIGTKGKNQEIQEKLEKVKDFNAPFLEFHKFFKSSLSPRANDAQTTYLYNPSAKTFDKIKDIVLKEFLKTKKSKVVQIITEKELPEMQKRGLL